MLYITKLMSRTKDLRLHRYRESVKTAESLQAFDRNGRMSNEGPFVVSSLATSRSRLQQSDPSFQACKHHNPQAVTSKRLYIKGI